MPYKVSYTIAWILFVLALLLFAFLALWLFGRGQSEALTPQAQAFLAILGPILAAALALLPSLLRTPGKRKDRYHAAMRGAPPHDL